MEVHSEVGWLYRKESVGIHSSMFPNKLAAWSSVLQGREYGPSLTFTRHLSLHLTSRILKTTQDNYNSRTESILGDSV